MERLLALWVEASSSEEPDGRRCVTTLALLDALSRCAPSPNRCDSASYVLPLRGPSRFFGGEEAVLKMVRQSVRDVTGHEALLGVADGCSARNWRARAASGGPGRDGRFSSRPTDRRCSGERTWRRRVDVWACTRSAPSPTSRWPAWASASTSTPSSCTASRAANSTSWWASATYASGARLGQLAR